MKSVKALVGRVSRWILRRLGYLVLPASEIAGLQNALAATGRVAIRSAQSAGGDGQAAREPQGGDAGLRAIVFSKDRPLQLAALLGSYLDCFDSPPDCTVLYTASDSRMERAYQQVCAETRSQARAGAIVFLREQDFRRDLLRQLEAAGSGRVFFLVDDIIFLAPVRAADLAVFPIHSHVLSLRLAPRIIVSYTRGKTQRPPELTAYRSPDAGDGASGAGLLEWSWADGEIDWGYAFSVDGHVFRAAEILELARAVPFRAPNSFESAMQIFAPYFASRKGLCYPAPRLVNIPCNRVQNEVENLHGELHQDQLLKQFEVGQRIDYQKLYGFENNSCHEEIALPLRLVEKYAAAGGEFAG